jgi:RNA 2',3'-cyclic 3'-phosphodiesterase
VNRHGRDRGQAAPAASLDGDSPREPHTRRVFIAVPLPDPALAEVTAIIESVRGAANPDVRDVRWVRLDGLHLTIRFIGLVAEDRLAAIEAVLDRVAASAVPFEVAIEGAGAFPAAGRPRALWLGVSAGQENLAGIAGALNQELAAIGLEPDDRPYRGHLTVARADGIRSGTDVARKLVDAAAGLRTTFTAKELVLFQTISGGGPARYEPLRTAVLAGATRPRNETAPGGGL